MSGSYAKLNWQTYYEKSFQGSGDAVVLVHGFSTPCYTWDPTFIKLSDLGFQVLRYDLYGRGFSARPLRPYNLELFIEQLDQLVNGLEIARPFHLVGLSYGSWITVEYCNRFPKNLKSLILIDPLVSSEPILKNKIFMIPLLGDLYFHLYYSQYVLPKSQTSDFFDPEPFPNWEDKFREQMKITGFSRAVLSTYRHICEVDWHSMYSNFSKQGTPLQIIWGEKDTTIGKDEIDFLRSLVPDHEFVEIPSAGHIPHFEKPDMVSPKMVEFLRKHH